MKHFIYIWLALLLLTACGGDRWRDGERLMNRGKAFMLDGQRDSAFVCFSLVANHYSENMCDSDKRMVAFALNNCGYISLFFQSNYSQAYSYLIKAKDICERDGIVSALPIVAQNLGNLYVACGSQMGDNRNLTTAAKYYRQSIDASVNARDWDIMLSSYINLVSLNCQRGKGLHSIDMVRNIPMNSVPDTAVKRYVMLMDNALRYADSGNYDKAQQQLGSQFATVRRLDNAEQYNYITYFMIAALLRQQDKTDSAVACLNDALALAQRHGNIETQTNVYKELEDVYRKRRDEAEATDCHNHYLNCKDSLLYKSHLASVNEMHLSHEVKLASQKIERMNTERRIQTVIIVAVVVIVVVTLSLLLVIFRRNRELDERNRTLYERNVELLKREEDMREMRSRMENSTDRRGKDSSLISDKQAELRQKIQSVLDDISTITSPAFNLSRLAELVGSNTTYVSRIINDVYGKNLSTLLSDLRIKEACRRINNPEKYGQFTLETISASVGFKSRSTFLTSFKRVTGLLPSEFLRIAKRKE